MLKRVFSPSRTILKMKRFSSIVEPSTIAITSTNIDNNNNINLFNKLTIIGGGNMSEAIIASLDKSKKQIMSDVCVVEPVEFRRQYLTNTYGVNAIKDINVAVSGAQLTVSSL